MNRIFGWFTTSYQAAAAAASSKQASRPCHFWVWYSAPTWVARGDFQWIPYHNRTKMMNFCHCFEPFLISFAHFLAQKLLKTAGSAGPEGPQAPKKSVVNFSEKTENLKKSKKNCSSKIDFHWVSCDFGDPFFSFFFLPGCLQPPANCHFPGL